MNRCFNQVARCLKNHREWKSSFPGLLRKGGGADRPEAAAQLSLWQRTKGSGGTKGAPAGAKRSLLCLVLWKGH